MSRWMPALLLIAALGACSDSPPAEDGGGEDNNDVLVNNDTNNDTGNNDTGNNDTNNDTPIPVCGDGQCEDPETEASCPQDCAEPQCEADEVRCADARTLERCNDPFAGFEAEACPEAQFCVDGACQDAECELGTIQCLGRDTAQACVDVEGIPTIEVQPCDDGFVCTEGGCQEQVCDPDAPPTCLDSDTALFCDPPGIATREQDCFQGQICLNAGCQTQLCNPGVTVCRGEVIERCNDLGTAYEELETCNPQDGTSCIEGECVDACTAAERLRSYQGCSYTALDLPNSSTRLQNGFGIAVANTSETQTATATVEIEGEIVDTLVIPPRGVGNYVDVVRNQRIQGTGIFNAAFRILSDSPVVVYQFNVQRTVASASTDASLLFPDHALFNQYLVMTYSGDNVGSGSEPYVAIAAIEDETNVTFTPTSATKASIAGSLLAIPQLPAGQEHTVTLNAGQVLSYVARTGPNDLTGSPVLADRPVAAFGGNFATQVPTGRVYRDHLEQQIFPRQALGERYVVNKSRDRAGVADYIRVMADLDDTEVIFNPPVRDAVTLNAGEFVEVAITQHVEVVSSAPVMIGQFFAGSAGAETRQEGDPTFILQVPQEQYRDNYVIFCPDTYTSDYVSVTAPVGAEVNLDGNPLALSQDPIGDSGMTVTIIELEDGDHELTGTLPFGVLVYGFGGPPDQDPNSVQNVSYGYPGGLNLAEINPKE